MDRLKAGGLVALSYVPGLLALAAIHWSWALLFGLAMAASAIPAVLITGRVPECSTKLFELNRADVCLATL